MKRAKDLLLIAILALTLPVTICAQQVEFTQQTSFNSKDTLNIFLLRGLTRESGHWGQAFLDYVESEFPNSRITMLDLPGAGVHYQEKADLTVNGMMEFIRSRASEDIENTRGKNIIMATSLGGMLATEWIANYPADFQALVMISSSFKGICKFSERVNPRIRKEVLTVPFVSDRDLKEERLLLINSNDSIHFEENLASWISIQEARPMSTMNVVRQTIAGLRYKAPESFPEIPTLIIGSYSDRLVCPSCIVKVHSYFGGDILWNETAGHGIPIDAPIWLVDGVKDWIDAGENEDNSIAIYP